MIIMIDCPAGYYAGKLLKVGLTGGRVHAEPLDSDLYA